MVKYNFTNLKFTYFIEINYWLINNCKEVDYFRNFDHYQQHKN